MIDQAMKKRLMNNFGEKADSMECKAEVVLYDPASSWVCYLYSLDPSDGDTVDCLINTAVDTFIMKGSLQELELLYNNEGDGIKIDKEYRPRQVSQIYKQSREIHGFKRD